MNTGTKVLIGGALAAGALALLMGGKDYKPKNAPANSPENAKGKVLSELNSLSKEMLGSVDVMMTEVNARIASIKSAVQPGQADAVCAEIASTIDKFNTESRSKFIRLGELLRQARSRGLNLSSAEAANAAGINSAAIESKFASIALWTMSVERACTASQDIKSAVYRLDRSLQRLASILAGS